MRRRVATTTSSTHLAQARIAAGLRQVDLAEKAGVSRSLIAFAEAGARPGAKAQAKIALALDCRPEELF